MRAYIRTWEGRIMVAVTVVALMIAIAAFVWPTDPAAQSELEQRWGPMLTTSSVEAPGPAR